MFNMIELPYEKNNFESLISAETFEFHYGKHYKTYLDNLNKLIEGTELDNLELEEVIKKSFNKADMVAVFNNAAQVYNHEFYFRNLQLISNSLKEQIISEFGTLDKFKQEWTAASLSQFGSGWVWLVERNGELDIIKTSNADSPIARGEAPLLCIDIWEHAYYIDYKNARANYVDAFLKIVLG
ncbi:MAG: superoxide dismutase [Alphaproteobacteria bacterium]